MVPSSPSPPPPRWPRWLALGIGLGTGSALLLVGTVAAWRGWLWAQEQATPWLSTYLSEELERPVELGPLQWVGPTGVRLGPSRLPPTATDPDYLSLAGVEVRFNPLDLLRRNLALQITLDQVDAYLEQDATGQWLDLELPERQPQDRPPWLEVRVGQVQLRDSRLTLAPEGGERPRPAPVVMEKINGQVAISPRQVASDRPRPPRLDHLDLELQGSSPRGGAVQLVGSLQLPLTTPASPSAPPPRPLLDTLAQAYDGFIGLWWGPPPPLLDADGDGSRLQGKLNLRAQAVKMADIIPLVEATWQPLPVAIPQGQVSGQVQVQLAGQALPQFTGTAQLQQGQVMSPLLPRPVDGIEGALRLQGQRLVVESAQARLGELGATGSGSLDLNQGYNLKAQVNPFSAAQVAGLWQQPLPLPIQGRFGAEIKVQGGLTEPVVTTQLASLGQVKVDRVPFSQIGGQATLRDGQLRLDRFQALPQAGGSLVAQGQLDLRTGGSVALTVQGDRLPADALAQPYGLPTDLRLGPVFATAQITGPLTGLRGQAEWRAPLGTYPAQGRLSLADNTLRFTDTFVQVAGGTVAASGSLSQGAWQADLQASQVQLQGLGLPTPGLVKGQAQLTGRLDQPGLTGVEGRGRAQATLAGGSVQLGATLGQGRWRAALQGQHLNLATLSPQLQGQGGGQFQLSGDLQDMSLAGLRAEGHLDLSQGLASGAPVWPSLALAAAPLRADLGWDGKDLLIRQAQTAGLAVQGRVTPRWRGARPVGIGPLDLNLQARDFNLAALPLPDLVPVAGLASLQARLWGAPAALDLQGQASLRGLALGDLAFASPLQGPVRFSSSQGLVVDLEGGRDRLWVATQRADRDIDVLVRGGEAYAAGYTQGDRFFAELQQVPLDGLRLPQTGIDGLSTISGTVETATVEGNWRQPNFAADFDILNPGLGYLRLRTVEVAQTNPGSSTEEEPALPLVTRYGRLRGRVSYADDVVSLIGLGIESASGQSRYQASGTYGLKSRQLRGEMAVNNGQIQDILQTLKIFELSDFRINPLQPPDWFRPLTAAEFNSLKTTPVGNRNSTFLDQLRRFAQVQEWGDRRAAQASSDLLPPLEGLRGSFSGTVRAAGQVPEQLQVQVDMRGQDWVWKHPTEANGAAYRIDQVVAQGAYEDGVLRLNPLSLSTVFPPRPGSFPPGPESSAVALAELNGEFSLQAQDQVDRTLRLNVTNLPVDAVRRPLRLPENLDGTIVMGASLTGSLDNPQLRGRVAINPATINDRPLDVAAADFLYRDARLLLRGDVATQETSDPLTLLASLPYPLPGVTQTPQSDEVLLSLKLENEGFALINLLSPDLAWESGQAQLDLKVNGRWPQGKPITEALTSLVVTGAANFDGVTLRATSFPDPLTNLRGTIQVVEPPAPELNSPGGDGSASDRAAASVYLNGLVLDFQNLQGELSNGNVVANGKLKILPSINDLLPGTVSSLPLNPDTPAATPGEDSFQVRLNNLALNLRNPAGSYRGKVNGAVTVDGSLYLLEPLVSGQVTLSDGVLTLPDVGEAGEATPPSPAPVSVYRPLPPVFQNFSLTLADNIRLAIPPIVDVRAAGDLALAGTFPDIKPTGRINLPAGRINLLTTEFRLTGNDNYAEFDPRDSRIDPYLVANLSAVLADSAGGGTTLTTASPFPRNEIADDAITQLGLTQNGVQTIRIRANVKGRASRLMQLQGVELESTPPRTEGQIIALISGGLLYALESTLGSVSGGGDSFQGLLTFAGSALINRLQGLFEGGLGNTELRLFPASPPDSPQLDIGADLGFNLSPNISLSVQKVFTNVTPALFSVRYRINDRLTLRGVTSYEQFNENTGAILELRL
ncbi:MAG: translocation/assembly module TamB domain-containing protein [Nodosilinea sp.]